LKAGESPIKGGGNVGLGLEWGDPGIWGATGKVWVDRSNAFQPAIKLGGGTALLQLDYLWHSYDVIHAKQGLFPLYFGVGGNLLLQSSSAFAFRVPVGVSYLFDREEVPVDIYIQLAPTLWFTSNSSAFYLLGELGAHYYF